MSRFGCIAALILLMITPGKSNEDLFAGYHCPNDVWLDCGESYDMDDFGYAYYVDYNHVHHYVYNPIVHHYTSACGNGRITRTFNYTDPYGHYHSCTQTIYIGGGNNNIHINWPPDYTTNECNGYTDPDQLPAPFNGPILPDVDCANLMVTYNDLVFDIAPPACKKILRKWVVLDWCVYDPNGPWPTKGKYEHTQIIKVIPGDPPTITCPEDITVSSGDDCSGVYVNIPPAVAEGSCGASAHITNNSPYASQNGANASGFYPKGETWVKFTASDGCGNYTDCKMKVIVKDMKKPTPYCVSFVAVSLGLMVDGYYVDLDPQIFDAGSFDNCTPQSQLQISISPTRVTCDDLGQTPIRLTVTDGHGNSDYCTVILDVQDNMGMCPPTGMIGGSVFTMNNEAVQEVHVELSNPNMEYMTNSEGQFAFPNLLMSGSYEFRAEKNDDPLNGITSYDLVVLLRHLFGQSRITNPYQMIAADVDKNGRVSASDLFALRKLVLNQVDSFEDINPLQKSWAFVDKNYEFVEGGNPLEYPDYIRVNGFDVDMYNADFVGVKIGDINQSATMGRIANTNNNGMVYEIDDRQVQAGEMVEVKFNANMTDYLSQQFTLDFDKTALQFVGIENGAAEVSRENLSLDQIAEGKISAAIFGQEALVMNDDEAVFTMTFKATQTGQLSQLLNMNSDITPSAAFKEGGERVDLDLAFKTEDGELVGGYKLYQNRPNPFGANTVISFDLPQAEEVTLSVFDAAGKQLKVITNDFAKGYNEVTIEASELNAQGILYYTIVSEKFAATKKMILMN